MNEIALKILDFFSLTKNIDEWKVPLSLCLIALSAVIAYIFCLKFVTVIVKIVTRRTETEWDDDLLNDKVLRSVCQLAPALLVSALLPDSFDSGTKLQQWLEKLTDFYILWALIHLINTFLQSVFDALDKRGKYKIHTMKGVLQMLKLFFIIIGIIIGISILFGKSPIAIITALGASAAVLMLIFQDSILGLVAGIQLTVNDMLKKGDWINVPKSNANGVVEDITLTTVKVRNWDNSITTVPPYSLVKDSFMNYNPMIASGARRVSRFVYIDVNSVRFLKDVEIEELLQKNLIEKDKLSQLSHEVNLSAFSRHIENYLMKSPHVHQESLIMVRQLQPTPEGIPLELYFFTNVTEWKKYEHIQADIFNYVYACAREFHLSIFQAPSGMDIKQISR